MPPASPLVVNGWSIYAHPLFLDQIEALVAEVEARKARDPATYATKNCAKRLAAILKLVTQTIPVEPGAAQFRQGHTLGSTRKHWFRAKFFQQYRLFYRFDSESRIIVLAWVNDENSLRAFGSRADAYATFRAMLDNADPPDDFDALAAAASTASARLATIVTATKR